MNSQSGGGRNGGLTIKDVARALDVSTATVSRAISGKGRIGEETARRVREYIREHNYVPNAIAQSLADHRTYNLGFIVPSVEAVTRQSFFQGTLSGICRELAGTPYDVLMVMETERGSCVELGRVLERGKLDGAIISQSSEDNQMGRMLQEAGVPYVLIGFSPHQGVLQVDHDHRAACARLTKQLLGGGRDLALLGGDRRLYVTQDRLQGYLDAHREAGIPVREDRLYFDLETSEQVGAAADAALGAGAGCLVCMDDLICGMMLFQLHTRGLRIPQDVQAASFYDSFLLDAYVPPITTLHFEDQRLGAAACRLLIDHLEGRDSGWAGDQGYELLLRASTGHGGKEDFGNPSD